jgi:nucleoside-diphosphate-sugar epimerase
MKREFNVCAGKLVFGCGYLGERVARRWLSHGDRVFAATRAAERAKALQHSGLLPIVCDVTVPQTLQGLPDVKTVLFAVSHDHRSGQSTEDTHVTGLRNVLYALPGSVERLIYISTTGVYHQRDGSWVDEDSPTLPNRASALAHLRAEHALGEHPLGRRSIVLRLAGIYGPNRIPRLRELQSGQFIEDDANGFLNLIHVDDACAAIVAAEQSCPTPELMIISDGQPVLRREFYAFAAALLDRMPQPTGVAAQDGTVALARRSDTNKRCLNQRMRDRLQLRLAYPSYRQGLSAILQNTGAETP